MKKLIDINPEIFKDLQHLAVDQGMNLKNYIEWLLEKEVKKYKKSKEQSQK